LARGVSGGRRRADAGPAVVLATNRRREASHACAGIAPAILPQNHLDSLPCGRLKNTPDWRDIRPVRKMLSSSSAAMLNLSYIFEDANTAMAEYADRLAVVPLPSAVYMMQVDVLNHYRYALTHYLTLTLSEPYLQNSSLGTPYQKWAFFVNKNFEMLSFAIHNLLRYTSRLVHETQCPQVDRDTSEYMRAFKAKSNTYTRPLCDIKYKDRPIGVRVHEDQRLTVTAIRKTRNAVPVIMRSVANGPAEFVRVVKDTSGQEREEPTDAAEFDRAMEELEAETVSIADRSQLATIRQRGMREVASLAEHNRVFGEGCNAYYASRKVAEPFQNLNEEYWV
jgi:hypothetical protein